MKYLIIVLCFYAFVSACVPPREQRIKTAFKVATLLNDGDAETLHDMIELEAVEIGLSVEKINHHSKQFQRMIQKYGMPDVSKAIYVEDKNDFVFPFKVTLPIFSGDDTLWNMRVKKIELLVQFGPEEFNKPSKIAAYELRFRDTDFPSDIEKPRVILPDRFK